MLELYGKGTHVPCKACGRKIFITEANVTVREGKRLVELNCPVPGCVAYYKPTLYAEDSLEIHGVTAAG